MKTFSIVMDISQQYRLKHMKNLAAHPPVLIIYLLTHGKLYHVQVYYVIEYQHTSQLVQALRGVPLIVRGPLGFSTVLGSKYPYKQCVIGLINFWPCTFPENDHALFWARPRVGILVSRLLNVVETQFFFKMTAMGKFILALITTLSSKPIHFLVNRKKLN